MSANGGLADHNHLWAGGLFLAINGLNDACQIQWWNRMRDSEVAPANGVFDVATGAFRAHRAEDYLETVAPYDAS